MLRGSQGDPAILGHCIQAVGQKVGKDLAKFAGYSGKFQVVAILSFNGDVSSLDPALEQVHTFIK